MGWERDLVAIVQGAGWSPGLVWTGAVNLAPHQDFIPDRLHFAGPLHKVIIFVKLTVFEFDFLHSEEYSEHVETKM